MTIMIDLGKNSNVDGNTWSFKVVPTKSIPLLTMIQLGNDAWVRILVGV